MIKFIILGGGWRSEFYLRIAQALPEEFSVIGMYIRNEEKGQRISKKYNVKTFTHIEQALQEDFDFIVNCTSYNSVSDLSIQLADKGYYVLSETPALKEMYEGHAYEKIQVAEQYHQKGTYQAIKKIIQDGLIGDVSYINLSVGHDYHAMSLLRFFFNDYKKPIKITDINISDPMTISHGRGGEIQEKVIHNTNNRLITFDFNKKIALYDYNSEQYFSPIRHDRLLIRGTKGEISDNKIRYFNKLGKLTEGEIVLKTAGLLEGFYNDRIVLFDKVLYEFPFKNARLSEEECAIAICLKGMKKYIDTGEEFYSYKKAYEDFSFFNQEKNDSNTI